MSVLFRVAFFLLFFTSKSWSSPAFSDQYPDTDAGYEQQKKAAEISRELADALQNGEAQAKDLLQKCEKMGARQCGLNLQGDVLIAAIARKDPDLVAKVIAIGARGDAGFINSEPYIWLFIQNDVDPRLIKLVSKVTDVSVKNTTLLKICNEGPVKSLMAVQDDGASLAATHSGMDCLMLAAQSKNFEVIHYLSLLPKTKMTPIPSLTYDSSFKTGDLIYQGSTALHQLLNHQLKTEDVEATKKAIDEIMQMGISLAAVHSRGDNAADVAFSFHQTPIVRYLVSKGLYPTKISPLIKSLLSPTKAEIRAQLQREGNLKNELLFQVIEYISTDAFKENLTFFKNKAALYGVTLKTGRLDLMQVLLKAGVSTKDAFKAEALFEGLSSENLNLPNSWIEKVIFLFQKGVSPEELARTTNHFLYQLVREQFAGKSFDLKRSEKIDLILQSLFKKDMAELNSPAGARIVLQKHFWWRNFRETTDNRDLSPYAGADFKGKVFKKIATKALQSWDQKSAQVVAIFGNQISRPIYQVLGPPAFPVNATYDLIVDLQGQPLKTLLAGALHDLAEVAQFTRQNFDPEIEVEANPDFASQCQSFQRAWYLLQALLRNGAAVSAPSGIQPWFVAQQVPIAKDLLLKYKADPKIKYQGLTLTEWNQKQPQKKYEPILKEKMMQAFIQNACFRNLN